jgi:hypothetical protein
MNNNRIAVLGFGKTGQAVLEFLLAHEPLAALVLFNDSEIADRERQKVFEQRGVKFLIGAEKFSELGACRLVIMSPGFDGQNPRFAALRSQGVKVISEIEYAFSNLKQINLVKKQDNLLSKLLIPPLQGTSLRSRVKRITKASAIVSRHPKLTWSDNEQPQSITFGKLEIKAARQSSEKNLAGCPAIPAKKMLTSSWQKEYLVFDPAPIGGHLDLKSTERGDRIHNLLARLGDFSSREQVAARIRELAENEQWPENDIVVVSSYLCRDDVFQLLCRGQEVHCEKEVVDNSGAIANFRRLDRLQIGSEDVLVIDFKTGQETAVDHETQMEKYLSAITPLFPGNNCRGFLLYIDQGEVKEIKCSN